MSTKKKTINFLGLAKPFVSISTLLVLGAWYLVFFGQGLNFGIDFAGGTEALVSLPPASDGKIRDQDLSNVAESIGLEKTDVVTFNFQDEAQIDRKGFFLRSQSQRSLITERAASLLKTVEFSLGEASLTWDGEQFEAKGALPSALSDALKRSTASTSEPEKTGPLTFTDALVKALTNLKALGVDLNQAEEGKFTASGEGAQERVTRAIGAARIQLWDTSDESGERIRIRLFGRDESGALSKAMAAEKIVGSNVSQENETRDPVYALSADESLRLKAAIIQLLKDKGLETSQAEDVQIPRLEKVGATAGKQLRNQGILAVLYALLFVLAYIALRFDFRYSPGAILALFHDVSITVGIFVLTQQEFNLPIIAALLAIVGYSLNDTIVVYDRIRENLDTGRGRGIVDTINISVQDCLSRTILTSVTTFVAVLAIFLYGGGIIKNFAFAMMVGVIVGTYSSIFIASPVVVAMNNYLENRKIQAEEIARALNG